jgi:hypothetical protein
MPHHTGMARPGRSVELLQRESPNANRWIFMIESGVAVLHDFGRVIAYL